MSMIKGKIETEREILPRRVVFGDSPFKKVALRKWINTEDPENTEVKETSLKELLESAGYKFKKQTLETATLE